MQQNSTEVCWNCHSTIECHFLNQKVSLSSLFIFLSLLRETKEKEIKRERGDTHIQSLGLLCKSLSLCTHHSIVLFFSHTHHFQKEKPKALFFRSVSFKSSNPFTLFPQRFLLFSLVLIFPIFANLFLTSVLFSLSVSLLLRFPCLLSAFKTPRCCMQFPILSQIATTR